MEIFLLRAFYEYMGKAAGDGDASISLILEQLFYVFAISTLCNESADFMRVRIYGLQTYLQFLMRLFRTIVQIADCRSNLRIRNSRFT